MMAEQLLTRKRAERESNKFMEGKYQLLSTVYKITYTLYFPLCGFQEV